MKQILGNQNSAERLARSWQCALRNSRGMNRLGILFFLLVCASIVYCGSFVFPFYYHYYELLGFMESQAKLASLRTDDEIRKVLLKKIEKEGIPIETKEDLRINRFNGKIVIDLTYYEVLDLELGDKYYKIHTFKFSPHVEQAF